MRFRKKPVVIDAMRFSGDPLELMRWVADNGWELRARFENLSFIIETLEGDMLCPPGWWLIRGVQGEFYPCKPEIFAQSYEPVP